MKLRTLLLSLTLATAIFPVACSKDKKTDDADSATKQNVTAAAWKISAATALGLDVMSQVPACYLDNHISFRSDLTGTVDEKTVVCNPPTSGNFTWSFNNDETEISLTASLVPGGNNTFKIVSVSSTQLVISQVTSATPAPFPVEIVVTLTHP